MLVKEPLKLRGSRKLFFKKKKKKNENENKQKKTPKLKLIQDEVPAATSMLIGK